MWFIFYDNIEHRDIPSAKETINFYVTNNAI